MCIKLLEGFDRDLLFALLNAKVVGETTRHLWSEKEGMLTLTGHDQCVVLSSVFQGSLCATLTGRAGRTFDSDQIIYSVGTESRSIYFLRSGLVKITALSEDGREVILNVHKAGDIFGEFCLCRTERNEMAVAMESSEVVEIKFEELLRQLQQNQDTAYNFLLSVTERLSKAYQTIADFSFDNLSGRLAKVLLRLADEFGRETESGTELDHYITQEEIAQMVSARREVVSAALKRLRDRKLIEYSRKGKLKINRPALTAYIMDGSEDVMNAENQDRKLHATNH